MKLILSRLPILGLMIAFIAVLSSQSSLANTFYTYQDLDRLVSDLSKLPAAQQFKKDHPDFPVHLVLSALQEDRKGDAAQVVALLEPLLPQILYQAVYTETQQGPKPLINTIGGFDLWRELAYVLLGRAYYDLDQLDQAAYYFKGIPQESPFAALAKISSNWVLLKLEKYDQVSQEIGKARDLVRSQSQLTMEVDLQEAFLAAKKREDQKAIDLALAVKGTASFPYLDSIRSKILAQSEFSIYKTKFSKYQFADKKVHLNRVISYVESVPASARDAKFSFLAGETYWHAASAFRLEDPSKYSSAAKAALRKGDDWIKPWVEKSISSNRPLLEEDAFFLAVALLWENEEYSQAIPRLLAIPKFFPQGEYREDTYQLLADYYFDNRQFAQAIPYYRKLASSHTIAKSAYGVYKAAWSFYNMQDRWAALRHLERLVLFFRDDKKEELDNTPGSLSTEAERDMLIVLAELVGHREAIKELTIFKYSRDYTLGLMDKLAQSYANLGKFDEAVKTWQIMIQENKKSDLLFEWLENMMQTMISGGLRKSLAKSLDLYLPFLPEKNSSNQAKHQELQQSIVRVVLTINKEAKKTDDPRLWEATDELYAVLENRYPNIEIGDFWYYGAQRFEARGKIANAVSFYQKAASVEGYKSADDSGLNALRIVRDLADKQSLKNEIDKKLYSTMGQVAQWYLKRFTDGKGRAPAEFLLIESKYKAGEHKDLREYFSKILSDKPNADQRGMYLTYNGWLYKENNFLQAHLLATDVLDKISESADRPFFLNLRKFKQETAFQMGFLKGKSNDRKEIEEARKWYLLAIRENTLTDVTLRSWHNLLVTYDLKTESDAYATMFREYAQSFDESKVDRGERKFLVDIYAKAVEFWKERKNFIEQARAIAKAASLQESKEKAAELKWDAAILLGSYYQLEEFKTTLAQVERLNPKIFDNPQNAISVARLYFWNQDFASSWNTLKNVLQASANLPLAWLLLSDLYIETRQQNAAVFKNVRDYLVENSKTLAQNPVLKQLYAVVKPKDFDLSLIRDFTAAKGRLPASMDPRGLSKGSAVDQLKGRLNAVTTTLQEMDRHIAVLSKYTQNASLPPQNLVEALCMISVVRTEGARRLLALRSPDIQSKQWPDFVKQLNEKGKELIKTAKVENNSCEREQNNIAFLRPMENSKGVFCSAESCFPEKGDGKDTMALLNQLNEQKINGLDQVYLLIKRGAWASAELLAYQNKDLSERALMLAYIRLARNDTWNAAPLLKEAQRNKAFDSQALLFLARASWANGNARYARELLRGLERNELKKWQAELMEEILAQNRNQRDDDVEGKSDPQFN